LSLGATAVLLALLDAETSVHLAGATQAAARYLRFHTGVTAQADAGAAFVAVQASALTDSLWWALALGSDEVPQDGATLVVEVEGLHHGARMQLTGPGIETTQPMQVAGVPEAFWRWRLDLEAQRPRGVDLLFVHGQELMALPRSTRLQLQQQEG
jgi:alpha-D-ribose 1-methylphosphonate 5-triphosphate synthase subunit PhnH